MLVAIVGCIVAPVAAAADPISSTRGELAQLQSQIQTEAANLHQLTVAYNADALQAGELGQQVQADAQRVQSLRDQENQSEAVVRRVAVMSYTGEVQAPSTVNLSPLVSGQYLDATMGNISEGEDQLRSEQHQTTQQLTQLRQVAKARSDQLTAAAGARQAALAQASSEQQTLQVDQQRLDTLLAEVPAPSRPPAPQGLGTGLVTAVQSEVSPTTSSAASTSNSATVSGLTSTGTAPATPSPSSPPHSSIAGPATTGPATTGPATTGPATTGPATTGPASTPPATTPPATTAVPTTGATTTRPPTTAPPTTAPPTTTPPTTAPVATGGGAGGPWLALRECESGDNYRENTGNGFYGAYQFSPSTWTGLGFPGRPDLEPPAMQDEAAMRLQAQDGWGQWPACSAVLGLG